VPELPGEIAASYQRRVLHLEADFYLDLERHAPAEQHAANVLDLEPANIEQRLHRLGQGIANRLMLTDLTQRILQCAAILIASATRFDR
jgi:hypothetical protein